jgi:hypothetical protein
MNNSRLPRVIDIWISPADVTPTELRIDFSDDFHIGVKLSKHPYELVENLQQVIEIIHHRMTDILYRK